MNTDNLDIEPLDTDNVKQKPKKAKHIILWSLAAVLAFVIIYVTVYLNNTAQGKLLLATFHFAGSTLDEPGYLLNDIDIMDLFVNYGNSDVEFDGAFNVSSASGMNMSARMAFTGERSYEQQKMVMTNDIGVLVFDVGTMNLYASDQTMYLDAPFLGDLQMAFPTDLTLFPKMPEFTSDIDQTWFRHNAGNILKLVQQISMEELSDDYTTDGVEGYLVTIPQGCGQFLWDLIGMEAPDYDVTTKIYLDSDHHFSRIEMDLSHKHEGAYMILDGENLCHVLMHYELPDDESAEMDITRVSDKNHWFDGLMTYNASNHTQMFTAFSLVFKESEESGFDLEIKDMVTTNSDEEELMQASMTCHVCPAQDMGELLSGLPLDSYEVMDWKAIRDDFDGFVDDLIDKINFGL